MPYEIEHENLGAEKVVAVRSVDGGQRLWFAELGATLLRWQQRIADGSLLDLIDGYRSEAELRDLDGARSALMVPWVNRIADARYFFADRPHDLWPGPPVDRREFYHGLLWRVPWALVEAVGGEHARLVFQNTDIRPGVFPGYPFGLDVQARYLLRPAELELRMVVRNTGTVTAPVSLGWHPYFLLGPDGVDDWQLTVPASTTIRTDPDLIPLPGTAAFADIGNVPELDFRAGRAIGDTVIDASFSDLTGGPDGRSRTDLVSPTMAARLQVWQQHGLMHVFTGDTLARGRRSSIALEPVEMMANSYSREECRESLPLLPGWERTFDCGVRFFGAG